MEWLDILVHDGRFWTALVFLVQTILFYAVPSFPHEIWEALSAVLAVVFATLTARAARAERAARSKQRGGI